MITKRYETTSIKEAVDKIKLDLGPDAIVLYVKDITRRGLFGFFPVRRIEVIAGVEEKKSESISNDNFKLEMIHQELRQIREFVKDITNVSVISKDKFLPSSLRQLRTRLVENCVNEEIVDFIITQLQERFTEKELENEQVLEELAVRQIARMIEVSGPIVTGKPKVVAFVGPTGVGKTTTIAKIAANYALLEKKDVGLVTIDTYRIAAVEQLKTYAEIMGIPLQVVFTPNELIPALDNFKDKDLILIDTAGRNPLNELQMEELKNFLGQDNNIEIYLLISLTTSPHEIPEILNRFEITRIHRLIITKLDEVTKFGHLLFTLKKARRPLSYITFGQNVPEDIELADSIKLASLILNKDKNPFLQKKQKVNY